MTTDVPEDSGSFESFLAVRGPGLRRFAYLLSGQAALADDLVQQALLKTYRHWGGQTRPEAYVRRAITNEFLSWRRRSSRETGLHEHDVSLPDGSEARAQHDLIWRALASLPRRQRAVLVLRYYEGLPDSQIGDLLGCATGTVRSLASRAFETLRAAPGLADTPAASRLRERGPR